ncbi:uncharacterized protein F4822DRAFT_34928 [Hypoxylon trugodes]|uniref:uncharacterized protein n=1 Tax=Hypoxylon trugodes TaxID=326681 RepID=UPI00218CD24D|nr:uncharacterized protein F4822DRAFT_34928 [Hypoxylon trugodes]KAI1394049.1 hypothetical protein F4822DRAFT_34928 [Hypoxylon trugodes]
MFHDGSIFDKSGSRLKTLSEKLHDNDDALGQHLPGLAKLFEDIVDTDTDVPREESIRRLLQVFWKSESDSTYSGTLNRYSNEEREFIKAFVEGEKPAKDICDKFELGVSLGAREELPVLEKEGDGPLNSVTEAAESLASTISEVIKGGDDVALYNDEMGKSKIATYLNEKFQNWGLTVKNIPSLTYVPSTSYGIQQIVKYAKAHNLKVRASGYRHSWSPVFGEDGQIIISTLGLYRATVLPNLESLPGSEYFVRGTELNSIDFVGQPQKGKKRFVRVGTAVTNQMFRVWCNKQELDAASSLPINVIMVEITFGGSNAPICHGAGRRHPTLSDLVHAIEYVDVNGNIQTISKDADPNFMAVASGCFGLLGIVTHITLELDPMTYAVMMPQKIPVMQAIPPPPGLDEKEIPEALRIDMTPQQRAEAQAAFERHAADDFYSEWFWFPYTSKVWVNCWNVVEDSIGSQEYPSKADVLLQLAETLAIQIIQDSDAILKLQNIFPWTQATLVSKFGLYAMPEVTDPKKAIKTPLPDALHFRRAIQNVRVRDIEVEIPLQPKVGSLKDAGPNDPIDWSFVQKAWWDAILAAYKCKDTCPQRMPLEMRITGPSNVTMAPFRGHNLGSCSIEVLTLQNMEAEWNSYAQYVLDQWMALKDKDGKYLDTRPHWAKDWVNTTVRGRPMVEYMKESYRDAIVKFRETMGQIAERQGWDLKEAQGRFSNELFDKIFFKRED